MNIYNSNFEKLVDFHGTHSSSLQVMKSIFSDFCALENCKFGIEGKEEKDGASFAYTTFLNFITFRDSEFFYGLNLSHSNFTQSPNFSNSKINEANTNRETFRIIKHAHDSIGNSLEANESFVLEMKKYKEELKKKMIPNKRKLNNK